MGVLVWLEGEGEARMIWVSGVGGVESGREIGLRTGEGGPFDSGSLTSDVGAGSVVRGGIVRVVGFEVPGGKMERPCGPRKRAGRPPALVTGTVTTPLGAWSNLF